MAKNTNLDLVRVNVNLPNHIVQKVKEYADGLGINTTAASIVLLNQALEQKDAMQQLPLLYQAMGMAQELNNSMNKNVLKVIERRTNNNQLCNKRNFAGI